MQAVDRLFSESVIVPTFIVCSVPYGTDFVMAFTKNNDDGVAVLQLAVMNPQQSQQANVVVTSIVSGLQPIHQTIGPQSSALVRNNNYPEGYSDMDQYFNDVDQQHWTNGWCNSSE